MMHHILQDGLQIGFKYMIKLYWRIINHFINIKLICFVKIPTVSSMEKEKNRSETLLCSAHFK